MGERWNLGGVGDRQKRSEPAVADLRAFLLHEFIVCSRRGRAWEENGEGGKGR